LPGKIKTKKIVFLYPEDVIRKKMNLQIGCPSIDTARGSRKCDVAEAENVAKFNRCLIKWTAKIHCRKKKYAYLAFK